MAARPLYQQVEDDLKSRIAAGEWSTGHALPAEPVLARQNKCSVGTVRKALTSLVDADVLERQQGRGTFVRMLSEGRALSRFFTVTDTHGARLDPVSLRYAVQLRNATRLEAAAFARPQGSQVWCIARIQLLRDRPAILERCRLPYDLVPKLAAMDLTGDIYSALQDQLGINLHHADDRLRAVAASDAVAWGLGLGRNTPVLQARRRAFDIGERLIELRDSYLATDRFAYRVSLG